MTIRQERTTPRKSVNDAKRATNLFGGMLKHMQTAKKDLTKERTGDAAKKKLEAIVPPEHGKPRPQKEHTQ